MKEKQARACADAQALIISQMVNTEFAQELAKLTPGTAYRCWAVAHEKSKPSKGFFFFEDSLGLLSTDFGSMRTMASVSTNHIERVRARLTGQEVPPALRPKYGRPPMAPEERKRRESRSPACPATTYRMPPIKVQMLAQLADAYGVGKGVTIERLITEAFEALPLEKQGNVQWKKNRKPVDTA